MSLKSIEFFRSSAVEAPTTPPACQIREMAPWNRCPRCRTSHVCTSRILSSSSRANRSVRLGDPRSVCIPRRQPQPNASSGQSPATPPMALSWSRWQVISRGNGTEEQARTWPLNSISATAMFPRRSTLPQGPGGRLWAGQDVMHRAAMPAPSHVNLTSAQLTLCSPERSPPYS